MAGEYGDGWITGAQDIQKQELQDAFREGAEAAGKDPDTMPKIVETFVVVVDQQEAEYAANLWRFTVDPWSNELLVTGPLGGRRRQAAAACPARLVSVPGP